MLFPIFVQFSSVDWLSVKILAVATGRNFATVLSSSEGTQNFRSATVAFEGISCE